MIISPSLLSADFSDLTTETERINESGAEYLHLDVMDGIFVPNISFGFPVIKSIRKKCPLVFDVHIMIQRPALYIEALKNSGADIVTFHLEADGDPKETIRLIKEAGMKAGMSIKPGTPAEAIFPYLPDLDLALVMTVEPGFGGQSFMKDMMPKVKAIREKIDELGLDTILQVDGGVSPATIGFCAEAGATCAVAGSAVFGKPDYKEQVRLLKSAAEENV